MVDIGVYSVGSQARGFFPPEISASPPNLGQNYEQNGVGEKCGRVRLNRFCGRKMGERYGARKAEIRKSERVQESRDRESAEGLENSVRIVAPAGWLWGA